MAELAKEGIETSALRIDNGSGLFDGGALTAGSLAELLARAQRDPRLGAELVAQLSIGGVDGTLRHRFRDLPAGSVVRAKTGTLANATTLSGYLTAEGRTLAFSVLVNGARGKTVALRSDIDRFVVALAASR
jgi:D-alanyl-D-alanine carboxypeptidase/D-alanyl-D-alanine-endopeptidase (penicillin-binding protein 4)